MGGAQTYDFGQARHGGGQDFQVVPAARALEQGGGGHHAQGVGDGIGRGAGHGGTTKLNHFNFLSDLAKGVCSSGVFQKLIQMLFQRTILVSLFEQDN